MFFCVRDRKIDCQFSNPRERIFEQKLVPHIHDLVEHFEDFDFELVFGLARSVPVLV